MRPLVIGASDFFGWCLFKYLLTRRAGILVSTWSEIGALNKSLAPAQAIFDLVNGLYEMSTVQLSGSTE